DFSVNAMAIALSPPAFGALLDPHGGRADLTRRRLRPLHPLSFVEDPTRMFRAARYAARLGLRLETDARTALRLALCVGEYPALSGQRLEAEIQWLGGAAPAAPPPAQPGNRPLPPHRPPPPPALSPAHPHPQNHPP